jgi:hypothetical protein
MPKVGDEAAKKIVIKSTVSYCEESKFPPKLLENMIRLLYDNDVIDEPAALKWRDATEKEAPKSPALVELKGWFQWLKTAN